MLGAVLQKSLVSARAAASSPSSPIIPCEIVPFMPVAVPQSSSGMATPTRAGTDSPRSYAHPAPLADEEAESEEGDECSPDEDEEESRWS